MYRIFLPDSFILAELPVSNLPHVQCIAFSFRILINSCGVFSICCLLLVK